MGNRGQVRPPAVPEPMVQGGLVRTVVEGKLFQLSLPFQLGDPVSMFPAGTTGYGAVNCYLLVEGSELLLVDTGFPAQREPLLALLGELVRPGAPLSVMSLRPGEPSSFGNLVPIESRYHVTTVYSMLPRQLLWGFLVDRESADGIEGRRRGGPVTELFPLRAQPRSVSLGGTRPLEWFRPMLHLLLQTWLYDQSTRTLFTSEVFSHIARATADGPWVVPEPADDAMTSSGLAAFLAASDRFWWLPGADCGQVADWLEDLFERLQVDRIAPGFGAVFEGTPVVRHEVSMLAGALRALAREPSRYAAGASG